MGRLYWFFRLDGRVDRSAFAAAGFGLMAFKYAVEALFLWAVAGVVWTPFDFLIPIYGMRAAKLGAQSILLPAVGAVVLVAFATMALGAYGVVLFMGVPLAASFATGWIANSRGAVGLGGTVVLSIVSLALIAALLLLAAIEGIVCIVMVGALSVPIAIFGVILGRVVARPDWHRGTALPAIALIPLMVVETRIAEPAEFEVTSVVEVDAPPRSCVAHCDRIFGASRSRPLALQDGHRVPAARASTGKVWGRCATASSRPVRL